MMRNADRAKWDARYREEGLSRREPDSFLVAIGDLLPRSGCAIDVAGGDGRNALWLAGRGLDVTLADFSVVALGYAGDAAHVRGLALHTLALDLEADGLPPGPWDLIVCVDFLWRPLVADFVRELTSEGVLVVRHPTRSNLELHERPGPRHLLDDGELPRLIGDLEILYYEEGWHEGRHDARLVARRLSRAHSPDTAAQNSAP
jgi:hypothetical protein